MKTFTSIIARWPSLAEFAADHQIKPGLAAVWKHRDSIPATHWEFTVASAARRRFKPSITLALLSQIGRSKREEGKKRTGAAA